MVINNYIIILTRMVNISIFAGLALSQLAYYLCGMSVEGQMLIATSVLLGIEFSKRQPANEEQNVHVNMNPCYRLLADCVGDP